MKVRIRVEPRRHFVDVVLQAADMRPNDDQGGMLHEDAIARLDQPRVAWVLRLPVQMPLGILRVVAVVDALGIERQPRLTRLRQVGEEWFPARREMRVDRIEHRIVRQEKRTVRPLQLESDLFPDLDHHGALREGLIERLRHACAVVWLLAGREIECRRETEDVRMLLHQRGVEPVHEVEMAIGAGIADVDDAQVDAPQHRVHGGDVLEDVRVHVDLAESLEAWRRRRRLRGGMRDESNNGNHQQGGPRGLRAKQTTQHEGLRFRT